MSEEGAALPPGVFWLADLPQRRSVAEIAFSPGWLELEEIFKLYPSQFVMVTGMAGSGKSTFLFNMLTQVARQHGVRSFLYVPENEGFLRDRLRMIAGGDDEKFDHLATSNFIIQSSQPEYYDDEPKTLGWVLDRAAGLVRTQNVELVLIDPWNELERAKPREMLMTDYIGDSLMYLKQFCRALNVIVILVAHPTKAVNEGSGRVPRLSDIEGSMNWQNKADSGLVVHREGATNVTKVISAKVREIGAGKLGMCFFDVDPETGIFTPQYAAVGAVAESKSAGFVRGR